MHSLFQDLRYGVRVLLKRPGFTLVVVLTLALGVGANTAIFSLVYQILLRRLPIQNPEQLVTLSSPGPRQGHVWSDVRNGVESFSYPMYKDLRDRNEAFSGLLARFAVNLNVAFEGQTERAAGELVSGNYFEVLGVKPVIGRTFSTQDEQTPGAHPVVVLSHDFWVRRFAADPKILNQTISINAQVMTVVGVAQPYFTGVQLGQNPEIFIPMMMKAQMTPNWDGLNDRKDYWLSILGRLKPGVSRQRAEVLLAPLYRSLLETEGPLQNGMSSQSLDRFLNKKIKLEDGSRGRQVIQNDTRTPLLMLMGMVGLVLLITCANVASLLIARGAGRQKEIALRQALGAGRWPLVRQLLVESLVLSFVGGVLGLLIAMWTISGLLQWIPEDEGFGKLSTGIDASILAFNFGLALLTGIFFGLAPALKSTRMNLVSSLKEQGTNASAGSSHARLRKGLVVAEIALTLILLVAAGLFARSLYNLRNLDLGVRTERVIAFSVAPQLNGYSPDRTKTFFRQLEESLMTLPGIEAASAAEIPLFTDSTMGSNLTVEGYTPSEGEDTNVSRNIIGSNYFTTLGIPLIAGREFNSQDTAQSRKVAIISQSLARKYFGDRQPIGRRIEFGRVTGHQPEIEIVGVVKDSKHATVRDEIRHFVYTPYTQNPQTGQITFYVRTTQSPETAAVSLRNQVMRLDAALPIFGMRTLREQINQSLFGDRSMALLSSAFGFLAALLAAVGIYGVMAYSVTQRTREIGVRMALGAQSRNVLQLIIGQGMKLAGIGIAIGLIISFVLMRVMKSVLFNVGTADPLTFAVVALALTMVALLACWIPAQRATRVDPMIALRQD